MCWPIWPSGCAWALIRSIGSSGQPVVSVIDAHPLRESRSPIPRSTSWRWGKALFRVLNNTFAKTAMSRLWLNRAFVVELLFTKPQLKDSRKPMINILALLQCLAPVLTPTTLRQFSRIILALLAMTGRVTMLGIARWTEPGGSYRTVQRFFNTAVDWSQVHWLLIQTHLLQPQATYLLVGDEVVVTKAGHETHGLDRFFSSLFGKPVPGLAFFAFALVNVQQRTAHPLRIGQVLRPEPVAVPVAPAPAAPVAKRGHGPPKGSKNRNKADVTLTPSSSFILTLLQAVKQVLGTTLTVASVVLDGAFGNNYALQMVRRGGYDLISKLAVNSALHFRYPGTYSGRGPHKKYGERVKYGALPGEYRQQTTTTKGICTEIYQFTALHQLFAQPLNVVVIVKTNSETGARAHAILFSSDLNQTYDQIIDYYTLRFQIKFNFRDAKQYWGLRKLHESERTSRYQCRQPGVLHGQPGSGAPPTLAPQTARLQRPGPQSPLQRSQIRDRNIEIAPAEAGANCFSTNRCQDRPIGRCQRHIMAYFNIPLSSAKGAFTSA